MTDFDRKGGRERHRTLGLLGRQRFQLPTVRFAALALVFELNAGHLVEKRPILQLAQIVLLRSRTTVDIVSRIGLSNEHVSFGIGRQTVEQRPQSINRGDQAIGPGIKDK